MDGKAMMVAFLITAAQMLRLYAVNVRTGIQ